MPSPLLHAYPPLDGAQTRSGSRRHDIQGMRGVALLVILAYHAGLPIPGGFVWLDVFFVISGYVITGLLQQEWSATGTVRMRAFYLRRFKRLVPTLAVVVTVTMAGSALLLSPFGAQQAAAATGLGAMFLVANVVIPTTSGGYFGALAADNPLLTTWSLSVEEQFYLVFPSVLVLTWVVARRTRARRIPVVVVGGACVMSFLLAVVGSVGIAVSPANSLWIFGYYSSVTRAWEFAVGALLALAGSRIAATSRTPALWLGLTGCALLIFATALVNGSVQYPGPWTVVPVAGAVLLIIAGTDRTNLVTRTLATRPLVVLGNWSYSVYLWHWPLIVFAAALWPGNRTAIVLAAAASFAPALACYRWVERPLRYLPPMSRRRLALFAATILVPPLATSALLMVGAAAGWGNQAIQAAQEETAATLPGLMNCMGQKGSGGPGAPDPASCRFHPNASGPPIFLVGDSTAAMYTEAASGAAGQLGRPLTITTAGGCPFIDIYRRSSADGGPPTAACRTYYETTMDALLGEPAGTVVISQSSAYWSSPGLTIGRSPTAMAIDPQERSGSLDEGLRATVAGLKDVGHSVVLVMPTYVFDDASTPVAPQSCTMLPMLMGQCPVAVPVSEVDPNQEEARDDVERIAQDTSAIALDLRDHQCPAGSCGASSNGVPIYMDEAHFSAALSRVLAGEFSRAIAAAG